MGGRVKRPSTPIDLKAAREQRKRDAYGRLVMKVWDDMEHEDKRKVLDLKAEVQIKTREQL